MTKKINIDDEGFNYFLDLIYRGNDNPGPEVDAEVIRSLALYNQIRAAIESTLKKCEGASETLTIMALLDIFLDMVGLSIRSDEKRFGKDFVSLLEKGLVAHGVNADLDLSDSIAEYVFKRYVFILENALKGELDNHQRASVEIALGNIKNLQIK